MVQRASSRYDRPRLTAQADWEVLEVTRNTRHLKVGAHRANHFDVWVEAELDDRQNAWESIQSLGIQITLGHSALVLIIWREPWTVRWMRWPWQQQL